MNNLSGLYGITLKNDPHILTNVQAALEGGTRIIQFRDKSTSPNRLTSARNLADLCRQYEATFIINDDINLAIAVNADGVHLGKQDLDIKQARKLIGNKIIGVSCYNKLDLAIEAEALGADYVAFGRFFPSVTKPEAVTAEIDLLRAAKKELTLPIIAIGGITVNNAQSLVHAGTNSVAVIDGLFNQPDINKTAQEFTKLF